MNALHLVFSPDGLAACERRRFDGDAIVLLADGVYATSRTAPEGAFVLTDDLKVRGVKNRTAAIEIGYPELVDLCAHHKPVVSWND